MINYIKKQIQASIDTKQNILNDAVLMQTIAEVGQKCLDLYREGKKTLLAGNGGSAADAQHFAAELVGRYGFDRPSLPSLALLRTLLTLQLLVMTMVMIKFFLVS